jgi:hypothetical protein
MSAPADLPDDAGYRAAVDAHRARRRRDTLGADGWIAVTGLHWLPPGVCEVGSAATAALRLPDPAVPGRCGWLERIGDGVRFRCAPGAGVTVGGRAVDTIDLIPDSLAEPTMLEVGTLRLFVIERDGQPGIRVKDLARAASRAWPSLQFWPVDERWRIAAQVVRRGLRHHGADVFGRPHVYEATFELRFRIDEIDCALLAFDPPRYARLQAGLAPDEVSVLFVDASCAPKHRSVTVRIPADGAALIDFNLAENPHCAFSDHVPCPLPPPANRIALPVESGEKIYDLPRDR